MSPAPAACPPRPSAPLTFMNGCLPRTPLRTLVPALSKAGFAAMTLWPNVWRHAMRRGGMSLRDIRALLDDHGVILTDVDAYRDWLPRHAGAFDAGSAEVPLHEFLETCAVLGGTTIVAVHLGQPGDDSRETESFAALCETAARAGLRVALEFLAFGGIRNVDHAWRIVRNAGQSNAGLVIDTWHQMLGDGGGGAEALRAVPADRIFTVQLADGTRPDGAPTLHHAMYERLLPADGDLGVLDCWRVMQDMGVDAPYGPEVFRPGFQERSPDEVAGLLARRMASCRPAGRG